MGGLLSLGKYPQQFFSALGVTFVVYPGAEVGEPGSNQERFLDNSRIEGPIPAMLEPTLAILRRNMKRRSIVRGLYREDVDEYPVTAVREAIINALPTATSVPDRAAPVQVQMFPTRLVVLNPGGLFGPVTVDLLGREGISSPRNNAMLRLLEDITPPGDRRAVCENRGSGVGAMFAALRQAGLPRPIFDNRISSFRLTLLNDAAAKQDAMDLNRRRDRKDEILALLSARGDLSRAEIRDALGLSDAGTRKWLTILREERKVTTTTPSKVRSKNVRYQLP